jgi:hypothetical protein
MSPGACRKYPETVIRELAAVLFVFLLVVPTALADGDPASDTLLVRNVFLPYPAPTAQNGNALSREVALAYGRGYRLKVAVIASERDLGAVPSLFGHPADYAKFLGQELQQYYVGPLLIVMPAGFGIYDGGRSTAAEAKLMGDAPPTGSNADELASSAASLIRRLVAAGALKSKDILPPYASALAATISPGKQTNLHYAVFDDSGRTRERLAVRDVQGKVVKTWSTRLRMTQASKTYSVLWKVPAQVPKKGLKLCLAAYDPSGNHAATPSCAPVTVKR